MDCKQGSDLINPQNDPRVLEVGPEEARFLQTEGENAEIGLRCRKCIPGPNRGSASA